MLSVRFKLTPLCLGGQVGEVMAELVREGRLLDVAAVGVMQGAAGTRPDAAARQCGFACFAAFFTRLDLLCHICFEPDMTAAVRRLLPKVLPEVGRSPS